jgi:hypothetical protein
MQEVGPNDHIKSLGNIQFNEEGGHFPFVQILDNFLYIHEIIMYAPLFAERCLIVRYQAV